MPPELTSSSSSRYKGCRMNSDIALFTDSALYTDSGATGTVRKVGTVNIYANVGIPPQPGCCSASDAHGTQVEVDPAKIYLTFYNCGDEYGSSIECGIQDLDCIVNAYNRVNDTVSEVIVYTRGYDGNKTGSGVDEIISAYCSRKTAIIAFLDWTELSHGSVAVVANRVPVIAQITSSTLDQLENMGFEVADWHLIGYSMGAHVMGCIPVYSNITFSYITGIDPAAPFFDTTFYEGCLLKPDVALFTDAIYTDVGAYSTTRKAATVNYYVNGGVPPQPGCCSSNGQKSVAIHDCSHLRALEWYSDAVRHENKYAATKCEDCMLFEYEHICQENERVYLGRKNSGANGTYCITVE